MKVTDYMIKFLVQHQVTDIYGYPGGCINHLIDSAFKNENIEAHLVYNEQGAAFSACGYAQKSNKLGVAYATSGPGATNLITGIASAYFDSIPVLFITGQVDSPTKKGDMKLRQRGFQETDVISCVKEITKWAYQISSAEEIKYCLEKAYYVAFEGNPGPVVLDIPNDLQRMDVDIDRLNGFMETVERKTVNESDIDHIAESIKNARRPVILVGNGVKQNKLNNQLIALAEKTDIPVVSSMIAFDLLPYNHALNYGFIGTNGHRYANFITKKSDLVLVLGNRMSIRSLGMKRELFAPNAKIIRVDVDKEQLNYKVRDDQVEVAADLREALPKLIDKCDRKKNSEWILVCKSIRDKLKNIDKAYPNEIISKISEIVPDTYDISADIGQNLVWLAQSYKMKEGQTVCMSAGNGPMGYSIPSAIGSFHASGRPVISFCGDGGFMMNIQELQLIKREHIPNKVIVLNNSSLGMIRSWQARYMDQYSQTTCDSGYNAPDFEKISDGFDLKYTLIKCKEDLENFSFEEEKPELIEVIIPTEVETEPNGNMHDQSPQIERDLYTEIMEM